MTGTLRQPRGQLSVNGTNIPFIEIGVTQTRTKKGDTFTSKTSLTEIENGIGLNQLLSMQAPVPVTITINSTQMFTGNADKMGVDFDGREFTMTGRDAGAGMMDKQTSQKWLNQQPNQVVQQIAQSHGIQTDVDSQTLDAGKMFSSDFDAISTRGSEWTYIQKLADHYGMVAYLTGGKLYFKNYNEQLPVFQIQYRAPTPQSFMDGNFIILKASRNVAIGKGVKVNVHSHNHRKKEAVSATASSNQQASQPLVYNHFIPMLNQDQAQTIANAKQAEIASHELTIDQLEIPGNETLNARMQIQLSGTNTLLDQTYDINDIEHTLNWEGGFRTGIKLRNKKQGGSSK